MNQERLAILRLGAELGVQPAELLAWAKDAAAWLCDEPPAAAAAPKPKVKRTHNWSPERRAEQAERARARWRRRKESVATAAAPPAAEPEIIRHREGTVDLYVAPEASPLRRLVASTLYEVMAWRRRQGDQVRELPGRQFSVNGGTPISLEDFVRRTNNLKGSAPFDLAEILAGLPEHQPTEAA